MAGLARVGRSILLRGGAAAKQTEVPPNPCAGERDLCAIAFQVRWRIAVSNATDRMKKRARPNCDWMFEKAP